MSDERSHQFTRGLYGWITHTDSPSRTPRQAEAVSARPRLTRRQALPGPGWHRLEYR
jgi:hypothetical protein